MPPMDEIPGSATENKQKVFLSQMDKSIFGDLGKKKLKIIQEHQSMRL
jgi:hypothetical protein